MPDQILDPTEPAPTGAVNGAPSAGEGGTAAVGDGTASGRSVRVRADLVIPVSVAGHLALSVAVAGHLEPVETLQVTDAVSRPVARHVIDLERGLRLHVLDAPEGDVTVAYEAEVALAEVEDEPVSEGDRFTYVLPSRYCPSDRVEGFAATEFGWVEGDAARALRIVEWVSSRTTYESGTTTATDDALTPLLTGAGVCRDYAHLVVMLCRAVGMPARYVSVYAPGLSPMDAHAVDGVWRVFDATRLAPRASMVRIGTGRDAADVAILSGLGGVSGAPTFEVTATVSPVLPVEDRGALVSLA
jgi:transglutaminase-like putative cysteine protease